MPRETKHPAQGQPKVTAELRGPQSSEFLLQASQPHVLQMPFPVLPGFTASLHLDDTSQGTFISSVSVTLT